MIGLGFIRFVLALMVVLNHLWLPTANLIGAHAVTGFYIVSGFLMTKVINEVYSGEGGRIRYLANRALRIYPAYLLISSITLVCLAIWPNYFQVYSLIRIPVNANEWSSNLTLWRLTDSPTIVIPPAWSLYVEVFFYLVIALVGRSRPIVLLWLLISLAYTGWMVANDYPFRERYYPLAAASLFFSAGAVIYFLATTCKSLFFQAKLSKLTIWSAFALFITFPILVGDLGGGRHWLGYYGASAIFMFFFAGLAIKRQLSGNSMDMLMGNLAYPVFLTHFFAAGVVNLLADNRFPVTGNVSFVLSTLVCLLISFAYLKWIEPLIEKLRSQIRGRTA